MGLDDNGGMAMAMAMMMGLTITMVMKMFDANEVVHQIHEDKTFKLGVSVKRLQQRACTLPLFIRF